MAAPARRGEAGAEAARQAGVDDQDRDRADRHGDGDSRLRRRPGLPRTRREVIRYWLDRSRSGGTSQRRMPLPCWSGSATSMRTSVAFLSGMYGAPMSSAAISLKSGSWPTRTIDVPPAASTIASTVSTSNAPASRSSTVTAMPRASAKISAVWRARTLGLVTIASGLKPRCGQELAQSLCLAAALRAQRPLGVVARPLVGLPA